LNISNIKTASCPIIKDILNAELTFLPGVTTGNDALDPLPVMLIPPCPAVIFNPDVF
jgi:hypothetical protein